MRKSAQIRNLQAELLLTRNALTSLRIEAAQVIHDLTADAREAQENSHMAASLLTDTVNELEVYEIVAAYASMVYGTDIAALKREALACAEADRYGYDGYYEISEAEDRRWDIEEPAAYSYTWDIPSEVAAKWDDEPAF